jgi:hypothetical protein
VRAQWGLSDCGSWGSICGYFEEKDSLDQYRLRIMGPICGYFAEKESLDQYTGPVQPPRVRIRVAA